MLPETKPDATNPPEQTEFDFNSSVEAQGEPATPPEAEGLPEGQSPPEGTPPAAGSDPEHAEPYLTYAGKEFKTKEELISFLAEVDRREAYRAGVAEALTPPEAPPTPEVDPADLIFEDPKKALELLKQQMKAEREAEIRLLKQQQDAEAAKKSVWDGFYSNHPDLKGKEELVELVRQKTRDSIGNLPISQALPALAKETRKFINSLRDNADGGKELPSDPAITSGSGGVKSTGTPPVARPTTLVDELRAIRNRKSG